MAEVRTYDAKRVVIVIGSHLVKGYAEDTFVSIEPSGDGTQAVSGADGEVGRSLSNNPLSRVTLTLQQTSESNDFLSTLLRMDRASGGGGIVPLVVQDLRGTSLFSASQAWIVNKPTQEFGSTIGQREWLLDAVETESNVGGNFL